MVTVVPLTSFIESDKLHDDVFLGNEIYKSLKLKYDTISQMLAKEKEEQDEYVAAIELLKEMYQKTSGGEYEVRNLNQGERNLTEQMTKSICRES